MTIIQKGEPMSDLISRQAAIDLLKQMRKDGDMIPWEGKDVFARIRKLPSAQPEIIHCKDCRKHNKKLGFDENYNLTYKDDACPLIPWRGMSKGHEHDYQFCCFGERREVTT